MNLRFRFDGRDGTRLLGWTNGGDGPPIIVCNGLGTPPEAWPRLLDPFCGYHVAGWNHRGGIGSDKPADPEAIRVEDHAEDALALMDHMGWDRAIFVGWSIGVNVSFEIASRHPDRVAGLVMCAGVPGGTFEAALAPLMVPKPLRKPMGIAITKAGRFLGAPITAVARTMPKGRPFAELLRHSGFMLPYAKTDDVVPWVQAFSEHDFSWYFTLMEAASKHEPLDPSVVTCPVTVVAGGFDVMTSMRDVVAFAKQIKHATVHVLHATHFVPLEFPDEVTAMIDDVFMQSDMASWATDPILRRVGLDAFDLNASVLDLRDGKVGGKHFEGALDELTELRTKFANR